MSVTLLQIGAENATHSHSSSHSCGAISTTITTTRDLLAVLSTQAPAPRSLAMLRTTCGLLGTFLDLPGDQIPLRLIEAKRRGFRRFLTERGYRGYTEHSIRTYVNEANRILKLARKHGWDPDADLSEDWARLLNAAAGKRISDIVRYFSQVSLTPAEVTPEDLDRWGEASIKDGLLHPTVNQKKSRFWRLLQDSGYVTAIRPSQKKSQPYGIPVNDLPPALHAEVQMLLKWKQAEFAINRPKHGKIRAISAESLRQIICQLAGYVFSHCEAEPASFADLVQRRHIEGFIEWAINERGVQGRSLKSRLGMIAAVAKSHPSFDGQDFSWFKSVTDSIPLEDESERKRRKSSRYLEYEILETIPQQIHAEVERAVRRNNLKRAACLATEELIMKWLTVLPWRQRNIRELRIDGPRPNLLKEKISPFSDIDRPTWVTEEEKGNTEARFWQFHFTSAETKTGVEVDAVLPKQLIEPLEQYVSEYRPLLLNGRSTPTLFLNHRGTPLSKSAIERIVGRWTLQYGGVRMNPHLARDSFAFRWLKEHRRDFLLLSKVLWHRNIQTTLGIYGARFDVSSGVCAVEEWLDQRGADAK